MKIELAKRRANARRTAWIVAIVAAAIFVGSIVNAFWHLTMDTPQQTQQKGNGRVVKIALIVCVASFLFGFRVMPPIYRIACEHIFGIRF